MKNWKASPQGKHSNLSPEQCRVSLKTDRPLIISSMELISFTFEIGSFQSGVARILLCKSREKEDVVRSN